MTNANLSIETFQAVQHVSKDLCYLQAWPRLLNETSANALGQRTEIPPHVPAKTSFASLMAPALGEGTGGEPVGAYEERGNKRKT